MNKPQWAEYQKILNWLQHYQQSSGNIFETKQFRIALSLGVQGTKHRLKRLIAMGVIKPVKFANYQIIANLTPEKIEEIKSAYIPKCSTFEVYEFNGEQLSIKQIFDKYNPPMSLDRFNERIARGWTIQEAMQPVLKRQKPFKQLSLFEGV